MYDNIGRKIKGLAFWTFIVEAVAAVIAGIFVLFIDGGIAGLLIALLGPVVAWVSSWLLYGFGEIIDKLCDIERNTRGGEVKSAAQLKVEDERIQKLEKLRSQGLITEEEYQQAISKEV